MDDRPKSDQDAAEANPEQVDRRQFLRKLVRTSYTAPVVATVLLSACQPSGPSGGMMLSQPARPDTYCSDQDPNLPPCPPDMSPMEQKYDLDRGGNSGDQ